MKTIDADGAGYIDNDGDFAFDLVDGQGGQITVAVSNSGMVNYSFISPNDKHKGSFKITADFVGLLKLVLEHVKAGK